MLGATVSRCSSADLVRMRAAAAPTLEWAPLPYARWPRSRRSMSNEVGLCPASRASSCRQLREHLRHLLQQVVAVGPAEPMDARVVPPLRRGLVVIRRAFNDGQPVDGGAP